MTVRTINRHIAEATKIAEGKVRYIFLSDKVLVNVNDVIQFLAIKDKKPVLNKVNNMSFVVTDVLDHFNAPIDKGLQIVAFRDY